MALYENVINSVRSLALSFPNREEPFPSRDVFMEHHISKLSASRRINASSHNSGLIFLYTNDKSRSLRTYIYPKSPSHTLERRPLVSLTRRTLSYWLSRPLFGTNVIINNKPTSPHRHNARSRQRHAHELLFHLYSHHEHELPDSKRSS